jgi:hypothetical protein
MGHTSHERALKDFLKLNNEQMKRFLKTIESNRIFEKVVNGDFEDVRKVKRIVDEISDVCSIDLPTADRLVWLFIGMVEAPDIQNIREALLKEGLSDKEVLRFRPIFQMMKPFVGKMPTKGIPPRPHEVLEGKEMNEASIALSYSKEYWEKMDDLFHRTIGYVEEGFKTNRIINIVIVSIGVLFSVYAVMYSMMNSLDLFSTAFGTLGVGTFTMTYFFSPQNKIQRNVGDLIQAQLLYRTYCHQEETILDWIRDNRDQLTLDELEKANIQLENITSNKAEIIEKLIGKND